jgi:MoaA/NifB/PqqE/SkfB family radical SAM enzyme
MHKYDESISRQYNKKTLFHYLGRRVKWSLGDRSPILAYMKVTKRCNLDCYYCPWHTAANDFDGERNTDFWKRKIDELVKMGVRIFVFEGGEPTLRKDLQDLINHVHFRNAVSILATNGTTDMWRFHPTAFTVSIDGPETIHDAVRGVGTFRRIIKNLSGKGKSRVTVITVISPTNKDYLESLLEEVSPFVDSFLFTFLYPYKTVQAEPLPSAEVAKVKAELLRLKSQYNVINSAPHLSCSTGTKECEDWLTIAINHKGDIERGCFVQHVEPKNCKTCELACFQLVSSFYQFNLEAWFNLHRHLLSDI